MNNKVFKSLVVVTLGAALITGCSSSPKTEASPTVSPSQSETQEPTETVAPTPEPEPEPVKEYKAGDVITIDEKATLPEGLKGYTSVHGGTVYVVDPTKPLPKEVVKDIKMSIDDVFGDWATTNAESASSISRGIQTSTGKHVVFITQVVSGGREVWTMASDGTLRIQQKSLTKSGVTEEVKAAIAKQDQPDLFQIVSLDR